MWEPILNETRYPENFALEALQITKDEYPYPYRPVAAADMHSAGVADNYDVLYGWPGDDFKSQEALRASASASTVSGGSAAGTFVRQPIFTREFGELVDDWYAHNNLNRASRSWGERPMLVQAMSLHQSTLELFKTTGQFIGGCQWHPFDHQRGYHPDPYWGGDYDAFRQPKTAAAMFAATGATAWAVAFAAIPAAASAAVPPAASAATPAAVFAAAPPAAFAAIPAAACAAASPDAFAA
jgi:beta-galactosidase